MFDDEVDRKSNGHAIPLLLTRAMLSCQKFKKILTRYRIKMNLEDKTTTVVELEAALYVTKLCCKSKTIHR